MADTIVTNTPATNDSGASGWVVALVILVAIVVAGVVLYQRGFFMQSAQQPGTTNINVTAPASGTPAPTTGGAAY